MSLTPGHYVMLAFSQLLFTVLLLMIPPVSKTDIACGSVSVFFLVTIVLPLCGWLLRRKRPLDGFCAGMLVDVHPLNDFYRVGEGVGVEVHNGELRRARLLARPLVFGSGLSFVRCSDAEWEVLFSDGSRKRVHVALLSHVDAVTQLGGIVGD